MSDNVGLFVVGFLLLSVSVYAVTVYNSLIALKNDMQKAWGNIDVLLKQRHDELPKLIKTCEAYMTYEKETLARVTELRTAAMAAPSVQAKAAAEGELSGALHRLFAVAEKYPELKSQSNFQHLQQRISSLENQIADRREFYNESVNNLNIRIESIPDRFVAGFMHLVPQPMFKVAESDRADVAIDIRVPS